MPETRRCQWHHLSGEAGGHTGRPCSFCHVGPLACSVFPLLEQQEWCLRFLLVVVWYLIGPFHVLVIKRPMGRSARQLGGRNLDWFIMLERSTTTSTVRRKHPFIHLSIHSYFFWCHDCISPPLLFSGFLDKNNDLLYRHLKEVKCVYSRLMLWLKTCI